MQENKKIIKHKDSAPEDHVWVTTTTLEDIYGPGPYVWYVHDDSECKICLENKTKKIQNYKSIDSK